MALIDVVKYEQKPGEIVHRFHSNDLRWGTQLVVEPGQTAIFVKGGKICDLFTEGTHTLKSENLPLLNKIVNIPFGGDSPFQAEVWFVSMINRLDLRWGTESPILLEDPKYDVFVPVRAYGQYGFKVTDAEKLIRELVGNMSSLEEQTLKQYFRGILLSRLTDIIANSIANEGISVLEINTHLKELSDVAIQALLPHFKNYGVDLAYFTIISVNVPDDDPSINEIKKAKNLAARLKISGKDNYQMERSFDTLEKAAENESGAGAAFINAGLGLGAAANLGQRMTNVLNGATPPPVNEYYLAIDKQQHGPYSYKQILEALQNNQISSDTLAWKQGMTDWQPISAFLEFKPNSSPSTPPPIV